MTHGVGYPTYLRPSLDVKEPRSVPASEGLLLECAELGRLRDERHDEILVPDRIDSTVQPRQSALHCEGSERRWQRRGWDGLSTQVRDDLMT